MVTHQAKKMTEEALLQFRDRFELPLTDEQVRAAEYYKPPRDSPEMRYLHDCRKALGGWLPARRRETRSSLPVPALERFDSQLQGTGERQISTTMAFVRMLAALLRDKSIAKPHRPDRPRRVPHVRHGGDVPPGRHLLAARPALSAAGRRAADVLQGGRARPDPRGGDHRGGIDLLVHRRGNLLQRARRADGAVLHLLLDVRLPARGRSCLGGGDTRTRGFMLGGRPVARRSTARGSSTRMATATCCSRSFRTAAPTTRRSPTSLR